MKAGGGGGGGGGLSSYTNLPVSFIYFIVDKIILLIPS